MIVRYLLAALGAGLLAGLLILPVQYARLVPLIIEAETYEGGASPHEHARAALPNLVSAAAAHSVPAAIPPASAAAAAEPDREEGAALFESRALGTLLADLVAGAGFALLIASASLLLDMPLRSANGLLWGLAGFAVLVFAPALGLAPELPAMPAADLGARQAWWTLAAGATALGLWLLVCRRAPMLKAAGVLALALPHLVGAPAPQSLASPVPPGLAAEFAVASLATSLVFFALIGLLAGWLFDRLRVAGA